MLPRSDAERIAVEARYETEFELAGGRLVPHKLGLAETQIADVRRPVLPAVDADREKPALRYMTHENLRSKVNRTTRLLERARPIEF